MRSSCPTLAGTYVRMRRLTLMDFRRAQSLRFSGWGDRAISRSTGIPYSTLSYWRKIGRPPKTLHPIAGRKRSYEGWRPTARGPYSYLLGLYLGDGWIGVPPRGSPQLNFT